MINDKIIKNHLRWYEYLLRRSTDIVVKKLEWILLVVTRKERGRPKKFLIETLNKYLNIFTVTKHMLFTCLNDDKRYVAKLEVYGFFVLL